MAGDRHVGGQMTGKEADPRPDPLVRALARFIEALEQRYPDGPDSLPPQRLAIDGDRANMRVVKTRRRRPAA